MCEGVLTALENAARDADDPDVRRRIREAAQLHIAREEVLDR